MTCNFPAVPPRRLPGLRNISTHRARMSFTLPFPMEVGSVTSEKINNRNDPHTYVQWIIDNCNREKRDFVSTTNPDAIPRMYELNRTTWSLTFLNPPACPTNTRVTCKVYYGTGGVPPEEWPWELTVFGELGLVSHQHHAILITPPYPLSTEPLRVTINEAMVVKTPGDTMNLTCTTTLPVKSSAPNITWMRNGQPLVEGRHSIQQISKNTSQLILNDLTAEDEGVFTCRAVAVVNGNTSANETNTTLTLTREPLFYAACIPIPNYSPSLECMT